MNLVTPCAERFNHVLFWCTAENGAAPTRENRLEVQEITTLCSVLITATLISSVALGVLGFIGIYSTLISCGFLLFAQRVTTRAWHLASPPIPTQDPPAGPPPQQEATAPQRVVRASIAAPSQARIENSTALAPRNVTALVIRRNPTPSQESPMYAYIAILWLLSQVHTSLNAVQTLILFYLIFSAMQTPTRALPRENATQRLIE